MIIENNRVDGIVVWDEETRIGYGYQPETNGLFQCEAIMANRIPGKMMHQLLKAVTQLKGAKLGVLGVIEKKKHRGV